MNPLLRLPTRLFPFLAAIVVAVFRSTPADAQSLPSIDPKTYTSTSGKYELLVDPSTEYGQGPAKYRLSRDNETVWEGDRPFTLWDAAVADDGVVVGFAYSHGLSGFPTPDKRDKTKGADWSGDFRVVALNLDGTTRFEEVTPRTSSRFLHAHPVPRASGLFIDAQNNRFIIRMADDDLNQRISTWRAYQLPDGKRLSDLVPRKQLTDVPRFCDDVDARPIIGTGLTLVHWWLFAERPGSKFTLMRPDGQVAWALELPGDYAVPDNKQAEWQLRDELQKSGAILSTDKPMQFELWHVHDNARVTYAVRQQTGKAGQWEAVEVARAPFKRERANNADYSEMKLESLGSYSLTERELRRSPIRKVGQFCFDDAGRIGFVRSDTDGSTTFVRTGADGANLVEVPLNAPPDPKRSHWLAAWLKKNSWIALGMSWESAPKHTAFRIDVEHRSAQEFPLTDCPDRIEKLVSDRRGGFIVLVEGEFSADGVIAYDGDGKRRWRVGRKHSGGDILMSPEDMAVATNGRVGVVCSFNKLVQVFDADGKHQRRIELKSAFTREPVYPSEIAADADGGFVVGDWQGKPPIFRVTGDGRCTGSIAPKYADGREFSLHYGVQAAPDGRLWTTDGETPLRLDPKGIVDHVLGDAPNPDALGDSSFATMDQRGFAYLVSNRTKAVHVFDSTGGFRVACIPLPSDVTAEFDLVCIAVDAGGQVFLSAKDGYLRFGSDGTRLGTVDAEPPLGDELQIQPSGNRWHAAYKTITLSNAEGKALTTIERRPDRGWLGSVSRLAVSPSGGLAAISINAGPGPKEPKLNIFAADGAPIATFPLPEECCFANLAYAGKHAIVAQAKHWLIVDVGARDIRRFEPSLPAGDTADWQCFAIDGGKTLALCEPNRRLVYRYRLPTD